MHNLKEIRKDFDTFKNALEKRFVNIDFDKLKDLDLKNRELIQKKESLENGKKEISKSREWNVGKDKFIGLFQGLEEISVTFVVNRNDKAHKLAEKGKEWTTKSGSVVKAMLTDRNSKEITLLRAKDNFKIVLKMKDLSDEDKSFVESFY